MNKKDKFSIRKIKGIVGSVVVGSLLLAPAVAQASDYHYVDKSTLNDKERASIKSGTPDGSKSEYILVYEKNLLPNTGIGGNGYVYTVFGVLAIGSLLLLVNKKRKVVSILMVTAIGLTNVTGHYASAVDLTRVIHESGNLGVVDIKNYHYVGYLDYEKELGKDVKVEEPKKVADKDKDVKKQEPAYRVVAPEPDVKEPVKVEKPVIKEQPKGVKNEPAKVEKPVVKEQPKGIKNEPAKVEKPVVKEQPKDIKNEPAKVEKPIVKEEVNPIVKEQPESVVKEDIKPVVTEKSVVKEEVKPVVTEKPAVTEKSVVKEQPKPVVKEEVKPVVTEKPAVKEEPKQEVSAKVISEKGPSLVQGENPVLDISKEDAPVTAKGPALVQEENPVVTFKQKGESLVEPEKPVGVVSEKGSSLVEPEKPVGVVTEKGTSLVEPAKEEAVVTEKGESLVQEENPVLEIKEKKAPVLTLSKIEEHVAEKSADLTYNLVNEDDAEIKSMVAEVRDGDKVVKRIDLTKEKLKDVVDKLKLYKDYTVRTTMVYNRGEGKEDESTTLEEKPLRLDLKKVEIKNIKETNLISVDENGNETDNSLLNAVPTNVASLYLKVTTHDNKVTKLSVDKIEEVVREGETFYKVTATAPDLVQHTDSTKLANEYVYYIAKAKQKVDNVYYDFAELVDAIQKNPEGEYKIGQSLNATNIKPNGKSYITKKFKGTLTSTDGNRFAIHNLSNPLFDVIENSTIKDLIFSNVNINKPGTDQIATIAKDATNSTIENVKITGSIIGGNDVAGVVNNLNDRSKMKNVSVIGKLHTEGKKGWSISGLVNNQRKANIERVYTDVEITGEKARGSALVSTLDRGMDPMDVRANGHIKKAVAKGSINIKNNVDTGGVITKNWPYGYLEDVVSYVKVSNAEKLYGSGDIGDDDFGYPYLNRVVSVAGEATGNVTRKNADKLKEISKEDADKRLASFDITSKDFEAPKLLVDKLNNTTSKSDTYKDTEDYNKERELAYRNIEKLQPFYNKEWIVNQGNKIPAGSNLLTKEVLSVIGMKDGNFVPDLSDIDDIMIHYADGTKEIKHVRMNNSKVAQVVEYSIEGLGNIVYTPNIVQKDRSALISGIKSKLDSVALNSPEVKAISGDVASLFLEESFKETKDNLDKLVKALVENEDHELNSDKAAMDALLAKVETNKAKIMMGLTYLNRYYGIKYGDLNFKEIMMFKPDFYGKNVNVLDFLIKIGSRENNLKGNRTLEAYREVIGGTIGIGELNALLHYNMRLLTDDTDINTWYKKAVSHTNYVVEKSSSNPLFAGKKYRLYENINNGEHSKYILPLLNTKKAHMFVISTYNTLAFSAFEKYGKNTEAEREEFKKQIDLRAQEQINYLDFWSRLAADNVRERLLKSENMVPSAIWDNQDVPGNGWADRMGHNKNGDYAPVREFYGPTGKWHGYNGMGAYAYIFENPQNSEAVYYIISSMISDFGTSAFTHETTHINDRMAYLGGWRHREGTDVEAFAQGMLQSPSLTNYNGEYGSLGLNMAYERNNDGTQIYNYNPNKLDSREKIDHYMKNYNEAMMMLDYLEADAVISKNKGTNDKWFKRIDKKWREKADRNGLVGEPHQWDLVRDLNDTEKAEKITSIDQLVDGNFATKHGLPGNGHYRSEGFDTAYTVINMMTGIYGGNTSKSAVGSISFKHNTFRMWGYFGYLDGFLGYASNKYKAEANKENKGLVGDDFIIKKVSKGRFDTLEAWKKAWYHEVKAKAEKGFTEIEIDGEKISTYSRLQELFNAAVEKDLQGNDFKNTVDLKWKVYKALLHKSDGFAGKLFNE